MKPQRPRRAVSPEGRQKDTRRAWEKEAGAAGGESDARSYGSGPGGGGRRRPMGQLNRKMPPYATTCVVFATPVAFLPRAHVAAQPIELQHMPKGLRRVYREIGYPRGSKFSLRNTPRRERDRGSDPVRKHPLYTHDTVRKHRLYTIPRLLSRRKAPADRGRTAGQRVTSQRHVSAGTD